jgi:tetratricopeptide (TPR) repeat protein
LRSLPLISLLMTVAWVAERQAVSADPLREVLISYRQFESTVSSFAPPERSRQRAEWLQRLLETVDQNPTSAHVPSALGAAVGIANSLAHYELSIDLCRRIAATPALPINEQVYWQVQLGEVSKLKWNDTHAESDRTAAIEAFEAAVRFVNKLPNKVRTSYVDETILYLAWMAELFQTTYDKTDKREYLQAAQLYREARRLLETPGAGRGRLLGTGFNAEFLASAEGIAFARAGASDEALQALQSIVMLPEKKWPASFYVVQAAWRAFPEREDDFPTFLQKWLERAPEDPWTCVVKYELAEWLFQHQRFDEALVLLLELDTKYSQQLLTIDGAVAAEGRGGRFADVLMYLREISHRQGRTTDALRYNQRFMELYPNYGAFSETAKKTHAALVEEVHRSMPSQQHAKARSDSLFWAIVVNLVVVAITLLYVMIARRRRGLRANQG